MRERQRKGVLTQTEMSRMQCEHRGRNWNDMAINPEMPGQSPENGKEEELIFS